MEKEVEDNKPGKWVGYLKSQKRTDELIEELRAYDANNQVRLIAGPGTGKSFAIEERVRWLINNSVNPSQQEVSSIIQDCSNL
jgi:superfamily I DNA/RNA helicase